MKAPRPFTVRDRLRSFSFAFEGLKTLYLTQHNFRIQIAIGLVVIMASVWLQLNAIEMMIVFATVAAVFVTEAFNTVFEILLTMVSPGYSSKAKRAKDIAAAAVLMASIASVMTGLFLLGPPLLSRLRAFF